MKLGAEQFLQRLAGKAGTHAGDNLPATCLISGDEPLLVNECLDVLRAAARSRGIDERDSLIIDRRFDWPALTARLNSPSLFSPGKLVELALPNAAPGDEGSRRIRELVGRAPDGNVVAILTPAFTRKVADSAWVKAIVGQGIWVETRPPAPGDLPRWIIKRLAAAGLRGETAGVDLLADRTEGNLLAAQQEIDKLVLLYPRGTEVTAGQMQAAVADGARFDVFQLGDAALAGDAERAVRVLTGLREEGTAAPLVLWTLVREVLILVDAGIRVRQGASAASALQAAAVWQSRFDLYQRALALHKGGALRRLLRMAGQADRIVKGSRTGEPWNALLELTLALAGRPLAPAELG
ncbi:MAG: DNA polymerase III subunit delta [Gammaproteobacteria bacterium]|nr:DNA polymerase III subunit delta [Gammaproteobacteria bacterium]